MKTKRPKQITPHHRNRLAVEYRRRSSLLQDPAHQDSQARLARAWGWPESAIHLIDEDTGRTGATVKGRRGFQRLRRLIRAGRVGVVLVTDLSRLSRSATDLLAFLRLCRKRGTLVAVDGSLTSPSTRYFRKSSPQQVTRNAGSVACQRTVRKIFRLAAEGKTCAEIAEEFNKRKLKTRSPEKRTVTSRVAQPPSRGGNQ
jgi:hypothetical protein